MKNITQQYIDLQEGRMNQRDFMRNLRMAFPQYVTNVTSFNDSIKILKNKGILTEIKNRISADHAHPQELRMGIKVEMEHTDDPEKAKKIALDHLTENPFYYTEMKLSGLDTEHTTVQKPKNKKDKKKDDDCLVDKQNQMKTPKGVEKIKASSNKAHKETVKPVKGVKSSTFAAKKAKGIKQVMSPTGEKMKKVKDLKEVRFKKKFRHGFLNEDEESELKQILKADYPTFVQRLGDAIKDPKFVQAAKSLASQAKINFKRIAASVKTLIPTQNEIDVDKSLKYPLTSAQSADIILKGGTVSIAGKDIVTSGNGKYIVDGHHRWSQVYVVNPEAKITALDLSDIQKPMDALKATQLGIAADIGKIPTQAVKGTNLLKIDEQSLLSYVQQTISPDVIEVFKKYNKGQDAASIATYIWGNVKQMQQNNQPVSGAPKRDIMPQTDDAPNWKNSTANISNIKENMKSSMWDELSEKDAYNLYDHYERTGRLPYDLTPEKYNQIMAKYGIGKQSDTKNDDSDMNDEDWLFNMEEGLNEDHITDREDQIDFINQSGHYKGSLNGKSDEEIQKIYDTVEKIAKQRGEYQNGEYKFNKSNRGPVSSGEAVAKFLMRKIKEIIHEIYDGSDNLIEGQSYVLSSDLGNFKRGERVIVDSINYTPNDLELTLLNKHGVKDTFYLDPNDKMKLNELDWMGGAGNPEEEYGMRINQPGYYRNSSFLDKPKSSLPNKPFVDKPNYEMSKIISDSKLDVILDKIEEEDIDVVMKGLEKSILDQQELEKLGIQLLIRADNTNRTKLIPALKTLFNLYQ